MEIPSEAIAKIEAAGFVLSTKGNDLVVRRSRPDADFTPELRELIGAHKGALFEIVMRRWVQTNVEVMLAGAHAKEAEIAELYETKPTMPGCLSPYQRVLAQQEWLATVDWKAGLRCGRKKQQCTTCRGIPCHSSTEWQEC
jgi:DNA-binding FadR family transcriptional regulator